MDIRHMLGKTANESLAIMPSHSNIICAAPRSSCVMGGVWPKPCHDGQGNFELLNQNIMFIFNPNLARQVNH